MVLLADDICLISLSSAGVQQLLNIGRDYSDKHELIFFTKKSMCMYFNIALNKHCGFSEIYVGISMCQIVREVKYLGVMIDSSMKTKIDGAKLVATEL